MPSNRSIYLFIFILCILLLAFGIYIEQTYDLMPCPLCMLQRFSFAGIIIVVFIAFCHNLKSSGARFYGFLGLIFSGIGSGLAIRQIWLEYQPPGTNETCLPGLAYLFKSMPFGKALKLALHGSASCGQVHWRLWGLSLAEWSLISFVVLAVLMLVVLFRPARRT